MTISRQNLISRLSLFLIFILIILGNIPILITFGVGTFRCLLVVESAKSSLISINVSIPHAAQTDHFQFKFKPWSKFSMRSVTRWTLACSCLRAHFQADHDCLSFCWLVLESKNILFVRREVMCERASRSNSFFAISKFRID